MSHRRLVLLQPRHARLDLFALRLRLAGWECSEEASMFIKNSGDVWTTATLISGLNLRKMNEHDRPRAAQDRDCVPDIVKLLRLHGCRGSGKSGKANLKKCGVDHASVCGEVHTNQSHLDFFGAMDALLYQFRLLDLLVILGTSLVATHMLHLTGVIRAQFQGFGTADYNL